MLGRDRFALDDEHVLDRVVADLLDDVADMGRNAPVEQLRRHPNHYFAESIDPWTVLEPDWPPATRFEGGNQTADIAKETCPDYQHIEPVR